METPFARASRTMVGQCVEYLMLHGRESVGEKLSDAESAMHDELERSLRERVGDVRPDREARYFCRQPMRMPVLLRRSDALPTSAWLRDLSAGGAYLNVAQPFVVGEAIALEVGDPATLRRWRIGARTVRVDAHGGVALRFEGTPEQV